VPLETRIVKYFRIILKTALQISIMLSAWAAMFIATASAQQPVFKNYNVKDGLPSSETYFSMQDSKGFVWVATDQGVARFDGYSFKTYSIENGLADNTVFGIYEDRHGRIWFRSLSGKLCYWADDSIYSIGANDSIVANIKNSIMISLVIDAGDTLWCGIRGTDSYYKIYPGYKPADFHKITPSQHSVYIVKLDEQNYIFGYRSIIKDDVKISFYKKNIFNGTPDIGKLIPTNLSYIEISKDTFLITDTYTLYQVTPKSKNLLLSFSPDYFGKIACFLKENNHIWISKRAGGAADYLYSNGKLTKGITHYLDGYSVTHIMTDNEGGKWFTTLENGLYYLSPHHFIREYTLPQGPTSIEYNICKLDNRHITISKSKDTIDIATPDTIIRNVKLSSVKKAFDILGYSAYTLPVIITSGNLFELNGSSSYAIFNYNVPPKLITDSNGNHISCYLNALDTINKYVYVLNRYSVYRLDKTSSFAKLIIDKLPSRTSTCYIDNKGVLWLGCFNGLWAYEHDKLTYHGNDNPYFKDRIEDIYQAKDGTYYFATNGNGIIIKRNNTYSRLTTANGLISNNCQQVFTDTYGTIWVSTKSGVTSIADSGGHYFATKYNLSDAFPNQKITRIEQTGNKLWLSSENGIISHALPANEVQPVPSVFITQFIVNDTKRPIDKDASLSYSENRIKISFIGLSYNSFGKLEYKYKLDGLDSAWHVTQTPNVQYQFLPPGEYIFTVKAIAANGMESQGGVHMVFVINSPFWQTIWFKVLAILLTLSLLYAWLSRIQKKELEKVLLGQHIANIEMKALRAQMNPHFIFNAINSIQSHILKDDRKTAQDYLARFARLIRNVMENSKLEYIPLGQEIETLSLYINLEQLRAGGKFKFNISVDPNVSTFTTLIPPLLLQPFVENSILHGLMPLQDNTGMLKIHIREHDAMLVCTIEDNGIGRKKAGEIKRHKDPLHRSMGISATEDRIDIINSLNPGMAKIIVEDKEEATGTKVIITIPLKQI